MKRITPYELQLTNPRLSWSPFTFQADLILINHSDLQGPPLIALQAVDLNMSARELLLGNITRGHFSANNVTYYLDEQLSDEPINIEALLAPLSRLPMKIEVASLHLISRRDNIWIFPLHELRAARNPEGRWDISAKASIAQRSVSLEAQAEWRTLSKQAHRLDIAATISGLEEDSELRALGYVDAAGADLSYQLAVKGRYKSVGDFLRALDAQAYQFGGNLSIEGILTGDLNGFVLTLDELGLSENDAYDFTASGTIARRGSADVTMDLHAKGFAREMAGLIPNEGTLADLFIRSELELQVTGTLAAPVLERTSLVLYGIGESRLSLSSQAQTLKLSQLAAFSSEQFVNADLNGTVGDLAGLLLASGVNLSKDVLRKQLTGVKTEFKGEVHGTFDELRVELSKIEAIHPHYTLSGKSSLLWNQALLSAPVIDLVLSHNQGKGALEAKGTIAELALARGISLHLNFDDFELTPLFQVLDMRPPVELHSVHGKGLLTRASDTLRLIDLNVSLEPLPDTAFHITGNGAVLDDKISADLDISLEKLGPDVWQAATSLSTAPNAVKASLRLRPGYATLLSDIGIGDTQIQAVATADLDRNTVDRLALDLYTTQLHLGDFASQANSVTTTAADEPWNIQKFSDVLPDFPLKLSLRSGQVIGPLSRLEDLSLLMDSEPGRIILREFDTRYAGGELILRGAVDYRVSPAAISLGGRGIRVPLGALTEDLGLQQNVSGALSFQGGLLTRGTVAEDWRANLQGRVSTALNDVTVSGAAYDLLMSNLLAWLVKGASEKTTTFSCSMAQFEFTAGVAHSDSIYIETPRMLATGKASVNLPKNSLDVRIEPRSKTRAFQFPSAIHIKGQLSDPQLRVSPLQASADLSAQALLLVPSLTLKLFGLDGPENPYRPCETKPS
ncbi:MAG: hypothetical protein ACI8RN_002740 [Glaciecola sp.]